MATIADCKWMEWTSNCPAGMLCWLSSFLYLVIIWKDSAKNDEALYHPMIWFASQKCSRCSDFTIENDLFTLWWSSIVMCTDFNGDPHGHRFIYPVHKWCRAVCKKKSNCLRQLSRWRQQNFASGSDRNNILSHQHRTVGVPHSDLPYVRRGQAWSIWRSMLASQHQRLHPYTQMSRVRTLSYTAAWSIIRAAERSFERFISSFLCTWESLSS